MRNPLLSASRLLTPLLALTLCALAAGQTAAYYCECLRGFGPCGNDPPTAIPGGCVNSTGFKAFIGPNGGSNSATADDLVLVTTNLPPHQFGLLFMGAGQAFAPLGDGVLCISGGGLGMFRYPVVDGGPWGQVVAGPGIVAYSHAHFPAAGHITAGQTWNFQFFYRDSFGPCGSGFNLSNGVAVTFTP